MNHPTSLTLENVRCFADAQTGQIRRVTLLVGENSTGKSTFLGCYRAFSRLASFVELDDRNYFDDASFQLGTFSTIVRQDTGKFTVEGDFQNHCLRSVRLEYWGEGKIDPEEHAITMAVTQAAAPFRIKRRRGDPETWLMDGPAFQFNLRHADVSGRQFTTWLSRAVRAGHLPYRGDRAELRKHEPDVSAQRQSAFVKMANFLARLRLPEEFVKIVAPDPGTPERRRRHGALPYPVDRPMFAQKVARIGELLGLFSDVKASPRSLDPREILVRMPDGWRNIVDVGYGVHSVLPLLADICAHGDGTTFLLQQPEVHIHPTAQAALSTVMAKSKQRFLIETHSDHLIRRFRISVMRGDMDPEELQILYFHKAPDGKSSTIHSISVDENGNLSGAPREYRKFFLDETHRLLGFLK